MASSLEMLRLNPGIDRDSVRSRFAADTRVQIRDLLDPQAAAALATMLLEQSRWGLTWQAAEDGPHRLRHDQLGAVGQETMTQVSGKLNQAMTSGEFAFIYSQYTASASAGTQWSSGPRHDAMVAELNHPEFLDFIRDVTGHAAIGFCDAQVAHFGPGQFLSLHEDRDAFDGDNRLVAYVLNLTVGEWRPDWGGYLNFFNDDGDVVIGLAPRFNSLNLFRVPQLHSVQLVAPFATGHRLTVSGWFRSGTKD